jgi:hypothetical protein
VDHDLIFRNGPYFMDTRGMYLDKWTPDFDTDVDVPSAMSIWVHLPHLPLHCWNNDFLRSVGNAHETYINRTKPKAGIFSYAQICAEVDLEKGLPKVIKLSLDN